MRIPPIEVPVRVTFGGWRWRVRNFASGLAVGGCAMLAFSLGVGLLIGESCGKPLTLTEYATAAWGASAAAVATVVLWRTP